jgi:hypothetical protein
VIDPRKSFVNGMLREKKVKLTDMERKMSNAYIPEGVDNSDSDEDETKM